MDQTLVQLCSSLLMKALKLKTESNIWWRLMNGTGYPVPPRGEPACGFDYKRCKLSMEFMVGMGFLMLITFILAWFAVRFVASYLKRILHY